MSEIMRSKYFWIAGLAVAMVVFLVGINSNKLYVGETNILIIARSDKTARNIEQIIANVAEIPRSLSFYDKLLEKNEDLENLAEGLPDYKRKAAWNKSLQIESIKKSGVIVARAFSPDQLQAEILSKKIALDTIFVAGRYYDTQNDLDLRIIDGPIVAPKNNVIDPQIAIFSLIAGLFGGLVAYFVFAYKSDDSKALPKLSFPPFTAVKNTTKISAEVEEENILTNIAKKKAPVATARKATAPDNLPVGSEFVLSALKRTQEAQEEAQRISAEPRTHEATDEEIRQRLNKLLGGKL